MEKAIIRYSEYIPCCFWRKVVQNITRSTAEVDSKVQCLCCMPTYRGRSIHVHFTWFTILSGTSTASDPSNNFQEEESLNTFQEDPLNNFQEEDHSIPNITVGHFSIHDGQSISVLLEEGIADTNLPHSTAEGIWKKAAMLIGEEKSITWVWSEWQDGEIQGWYNPSFGNCSRVTKRCSTNMMTNAHGTSPCIFIHTQLLLLRLIEI